MVIGKFIPSFPHFPEKIKFKLPTFLKKLTLKRKRKFKKEKYKFVTLYSPRSHI